VKTIRAVHRRLRPVSPFVAAHGSFPQEDGSRSRWLARYEAYAVASGADREQATLARAAVQAHLPTLAPETDAALLREGGIRQVDLFFAAFTWRGWIGRA
jgi:tRNA (cmo5U34)-methyltransferase